MTVTGLWPINSDLARESILLLPADVDFVIFADQIISMAGRWTYNRFRAADEHGRDRRLGAG